jgi:hypothetical protein
VSLVDQHGHAIEPAEAPAQAVPPIRVCVAIPSGDHVAAGFAFDLANMVGATIATRKDVDLRLSNIQGTIIHKSRRDLVRLALKGGCTHLLFLDSDMRFPRNTLVRLLSHSVPFVAANYTTRRQRDVKPVTFATDQNDYERVFSELDSTGLQEVDSVGLGVALIDMQVFQALPGPWFAFEWFNEGRHMVGEDVYFCRKMRKELGVPVLIDHDLSHEVRHVGSFEYHMTDALVQRDLATEEAAEAGLGEAPEVN